MAAGLGGEVNVALVQCCWVRLVDDFRSRVAVYGQLGNVCVNAVQSIY